jgi:AcrR family transcriptional regulator
MDMSIPYEETGRRKQKARTRTALVEAARAILAGGGMPTVEQAADRAGISRTTAYRYFTNRRALVIATYPELDESSLLGDSPPSDPLERLELVARRFTSQVVAHEPELRAQLRLSLDPASGPDTLPLRQGRAIGWIQEALEPLRERLTKRELRDLTLAIRATLGIEALIWLTDVAGLTREEATSLMRASASTLLRGATTGTTR